MQKSGIGTHVDIVACEKGYQVFIPSLVIARFFSQHLLIKLAIKTPQRSH